MNTALQSLQAAALTGRQQEILSLVAKGFTNLDIGELLGIARGTVKNHVATIIERLEKDQVPCPALKSRIDIASFPQRVLPTVLLYAE